MCFLALFFLLLLAAGCAAGPTPAPNACCGGTTPSAEITPTASLLPGGTAPAELTPSLTPEARPTETPEPDPSPTIPAAPSATPGASGPDDFPPNINPLTGLAFDGSADPSLAPGLISISNSPVTTRPQSGLSYAARVYEFYLGQGDTRFLSVFYGRLPPLTAADGSPVVLGPLRSGRLPYETLRDFYKGFLVFASASDQVLDQLHHYLIVQNPTIQNINGASIPVKSLLELGKDTADTLGSPNLTGQRYDPLPPEGGKPASKLWMAYHLYSQVFWKYDAQKQAYTRWQNDGPGTPLRQFTDRINNHSLAYENVIVLFTNYVRYTETYFNIDLKFVYRWPALLFRDGKVYKIYWTTRNDAYEKRTGQLRAPRFIDYDGNPFPLKPGQTWIEIAQLNNPYYETVDSEDYMHLRDGLMPGSGIWAVYFIPPDFTPKK